MIAVIVDQTHHRQRRNRPTESPVPAQGVWAIWPGMGFFLGWVSRIFFSPVFAQPPSPRKGGVKYCYLILGRFGFSMKCNTICAPQTGWICECSTLQHPAAPGSTLQHTAAHCSTLQHTAAHCSTLQHTAAHCSTLQHTAAHCSTLQHTAAYCITLHHTAPHCTTCKTLQRTATHFKHTALKSHELNDCVKSTKWTSHLNITNSTQFHASDNCVKSTNWMGHTTTSTESHEPD